MNITNIIRNDEAIFYLVVDIGAIGKRTEEEIFQKIKLFLQEKYREHLIVSNIFIQDVYHEEIKWPFQFFVASVLPKTPGIIENIAEQNGIKIVKSKS